MSRLNNLSNPLDLRTANIFRASNGAIVAAPKRLKSFLADYNEVIPSLPSNISANVSSLESQFSKLKNDEKAYQKSLKIASLNDNISLVNKRSSQVSYYINRLTTVLNGLNQLKSHPDATIKSKAISLYNSTNSYLTALNNLQTSFAQIKSNLQKAIANV